MPTQYSAREIKSFSPKEPIRALLEHFFARTPIRNGPRSPKAMAKSAATRWCGSRMPRTEVFRINGAGENEYQTFTRPPSSEADRRSRDHAQRNRNSRF